MTREPLLSIVVTSYSTERLKDIYDLLESLRVQSYPEIEVIFVAERSAELMDKVQAYVVEKGMSGVKVLFNTGEPGLSAARNLGVMQAKGDVIAFVDDDVVVFPDWAEEMMKVYQDDAVIGVTGPALPLWENISMSWFPEELYWIITCTAWSGLNCTQTIRNAWGMNMSFRSEAFSKAGLFRTDFGLCNSKRNRWFDPPAEDVDFSLRAKSQTGKVIVYNPSVRIQHKVYRYRINQKFVMQRSFSVGYQRRLINRLYSKVERKANALNQERTLLKRIMTRLLPGILRGFFIRPVYSARRFETVITSLTFIVIGYCYSLVIARTIKSDIEI